MLTLLTSDDTTYHTARVSRYYYHPDRYSFSHRLSRAHLPVSSFDFRCSPVRSVNRLAIRSLNAVQCTPSLACHVKPVFCFLFISPPEEYHGQRSAQDLHENRKRPSLFDGYDGQDVGLQRLSDLGHRSTASDQTTAGNRRHNLGDRPLQV